jgi:hypothetical protein
MRSATGLDGFRPRRVSSGLRANRLRTRGLRAGCTLPSKARRLGPGSTASRSSTLRRCRMDDGRRRRHTLEDGRRRSGLGSRARLWIRPERRRSRRSNQSGDPEQHQYPGHAGFHRRRPRSRPRCSPVRHGRRGQPMRLRGRGVGRLGLRDVGRLVRRGGGRVVRLAASGVIGRGRHRSDRSRVGRLAVFDELES